MDKTVQHQLSHILYEYGMLSAESAVIAEDAGKKDQRLALIHSVDVSDEPVIQFVNQLLQDALRQTISDIHIEMQAENCRIRFRQDGLLHEVATLPVSFALRIMTRLKIMANLDIAEKRLPQDGRIQFQHSIPVDLRISTCPGLHGEKIVLRVLRMQQENRAFIDLGMSAAQCALFQSALQQPQGLILVTGPTGSGKTATLYSALQLLNQMDKNILTVEDPVEIELPGLTQVAVNPRIGLTFATVLRAFLRQDPDILMVGEIRDAETAAMAVEAAQTGHLVLSTLHTNNAIDTIKRLLTLNISLPQLAGSLTLLAAQRLIRKYCLYCERQGCGRCRNGYAGRTGIFEIMPVTAAISELLLANTSLRQIEEQMRNAQYNSLYQHGLEKIAAGITSEEELTRMVGNIDHVTQISCAPSGA